MLVDLNLLAEGKPFMALGDMAVSDDGWLLAYSTDETGFRQYTLVVKDLRTEVETSQLDTVLDGDLDEFMEGYLRWRRREAE